MNFHWLDGCLSEEPYWKRLMMFLLGTLFLSRWPQPESGQSGEGRKYQSSCPVPHVLAESILEFKSQVESSLVYQ